MKVEKYLRNISCLLTNFYKMYVYMYTCINSLNKTMLFELILLPSKAKNHCANHGKPPPLHCMSWRSLRVLKYRLLPLPLFASQNLNLSPYCNVSDTQLGRIKVEFHWKRPLEVFAFIVSKTAGQATEGRKRSQSCPDVKPQQINHNGKMSPRAQ